MSRALKSVSGVENVQVDLGAKRAMVSHQGADIQEMKNAVDEAGYEVVSVV